MGECQWFPRNDSMYYGAIFMSNRKTKQECFERQLFGLPSSQAGFVKKLKAGMLLFLFEHEERKLYGVFEAMCDGSSNIVPNAFSSSRMSFPAQILFKRIWMCKPLVEDEFRNAIKENYYTSQKFNFGLSYEQVYRLLHLFYSKKINLEQNQEPGIPNDVIQTYKKSNFDFTVPSKNRFSFQAGVHNIDDSLDSSNRSGQSIFDKRREIGLGNLLPDNDPPDSHAVQGSANELRPAALDIHPSLDQEYTIFDKRPEVVFENSLCCNVLPGNDAVQGSVNELRPVGLDIHPPLTKEGMTSSMFSSNISHGCSKVFHHEELLTGSSPQKDGSVETGDSSRLPNILLKAACDVPQKCEEDNNDSEPDQMLCDGNYPLLQSDVTQRSKSAFSRLSNPKPSKDAQACELDKSLSQLLETLIERGNQWSTKAEVNQMQGNMYLSNPLISKGRDQWSMKTEVNKMQGNKLVNNPSISERREQWSMKTEVIPTQSNIFVKNPSKSERRDQWGMKTEVKQKQHNLVNKPSISEKGDKMMVQPMQGNLFAKKPLVDTSGAEESDIDAALSSCKMFTEEIVQLPFVNFKRKKAQEFKRVTEMKYHVVNGDGGRQYTRRRLVRPSFSEEEHGVDMAMLIDESQNLMSGVPDGSLTLVSPGSGVPDGASTWVRLETLLAQANASGVVIEDKELKASNASETQANASGVVIEDKELKASNASEAVSNCEGFILSQANASGVVIEDEELKANNASEAVSNCEGFILAQANASGVVIEDEELKANNALEAVSNCAAFIPLVHSDAGAQVLDQHDYSSPVSPAKRKAFIPRVHSGAGPLVHSGAGRQVLDQHDYSSPVSPAKRKAFIPLVHSGVRAQVLDQHDYSSPVSPAKRKGGEIAELSPKRQDTSQKGSNTSEPFNNCEASGSGGGESDKIPLWVRLKAIAAQLKR